MEHKIWARISGRHQKKHMQQRIVLGKRVWHWEKLVGQTTEGNIRKKNQNTFLLWGIQTWHWQDTPNMKRKSWAINKKQCQTKKRENNYTVSDRHTWHWEEQKINMKHQSHSLQAFSIPRFGHGTVDCSPASSHWEIHGQDRFVQWLDPAQ